VLNPWKESNGGATDCKKASRQEQGEDQDIGHQEDEDKDAIALMNRSLMHIFDVLMHAEFCYVCCGPWPPSRPESTVVNKESSSVNGW
jgi:hypothetical protein